MVIETRQARARNETVTQEPRLYELNEERVQPSKLVTKFKINWPDSIG